ncbi:MAG: DUF2141 domain-containing protein [Catalinimonas sp.]
MKKIICLTLFCFAAASSVRAQGTLTLSISGLETQKGKVYVAIYNQAEGWLESETSFKRGIFATSGDPTQIKFEDVPAGTYAVSLYHDENGNGEMDSNLVGVPKEGYGFSQNPKITFSAPDFDECAFEHSGAQTLNIKLK